MSEDKIRHGLDDNPTGDAEKGAVLGGAGGLVTGAVAGAAAGPGGAIIGAIVGGAIGAAASGAAVAAVDRHDNDNTVTGIGKAESDWAEHDSDWQEDYNRNYASTGMPYENNYQHAYRFGHDLARHDNYRGRSWNEIEPDARRDWEASNPGTWDTYRGPIGSSWERATGLGNGVPGIQTGGTNADGSADTRGITEKIADTVTGDRIDDKTGQRVDEQNFDQGSYAYADKPEGNTDRDLNR